ncbi:MAG: ABC transporter ATP-binding protein [Nanoarchaeota archaeon]|nr:ABC transporter ATP-binding protein [Nanoarchaeota archaeon]MBU1322257.1 ABC transporter ATP-binding protein [Nanoarchaeota archaeon]MBU1598237.1 ABC transporter ATP-binding protein [Nanoarchaeota archaeon]MBU2441990.1 ABC transporter ATP-binding protein [Nanoarchaeota archaeon]
MNQTYLLDLKNIYFSYPDESEIIILRDFSLKIKKGEIISILGANGCGKTTLLNIISGFLKPDKGNIIWSEKNKKSLLTSLVFQQANLLEWKTGYQNIELSLISHISDKKKRKKIVNNMLNLLEIYPHKNKLPRQMSGGIKQRTTVARALAPKPQILLLDEPFSAVDIASKEKLMKDIKKVIKKQEQSTILVTHNLDEALLFADKILIMNSKKRNIKEIDNIRQISKKEIIRILNMKK